MEQLKNYWLNFFNEDFKEADWWRRKKELFKARQATVVKISGDGHLVRKIKYDAETFYEYLFHLSLLVKQHDDIYIEDCVIPYQFRLQDGEIIDHRKLSKAYKIPHEKVMIPIEAENSHKKRFERFTYDRHKAVQYAERWWNSYNPAYRAFDVDCTNYVSQCLRAGGAPMWGAPERERGWWYQGDQWSLSWAVAHSLRWYLSGSTKGLQGTEVQTPEELYPGDIICYDFQGDGRWDHNTIVVAKDVYDMPLVNAHTDNSRYRYWSYEDSTAWTPEIKYKFFRIGES